MWPSKFSYAGPGQITSVNQNQCSSDPHSASVTNGRARCVEEQVDASGLYYFDISRGFPIPIHKNPPAIGDR
jgi:hypothetical protein